MFTSRLPKSTTGGRPSNPNDGSTSSIRSNIPLSVRKANLFTPQPKRSMTGGLNSTSRKSYLTTDKKYPRPSKPAPNHDEQLKMYERLVAYLMEKEPDFPVSEAKRFFASLSTTECLRIFEFLFNRIMPGFKINQALNQTNKLEVQDVQEGLALLDYPYLRAVTRSSLVSITTRPAVVNILVIFDWLVSECRQSDLDQPKATFDDDNQIESQILSCILSNPSDPVREFESRLNSQEPDIEPLIKNLEQTKENVERLKKEWDEVQGLNELRKAYEKDLQECHRYDSEISDYLAIKEKHFAASDLEASQRRKRLVELKDQYEKIGPLVKIDESKGDEDNILTELTQKLEIAKAALKNEDASATTAQVLRLKKDELESIENKGMEQKKKAVEITEKESEEANAVKLHYELIVEKNTELLQAQLDSYGKKIDSILKEGWAEAGRLSKIKAAIKADNKKIRAVGRKLKRGAAAGELTTAS